jgi:hypothetical protein
MLSQFMANVPGAKASLAKIKNVADKYPYYKYNGIWSRYMETLSFAIVFAGWLGAFGEPEGTLLSYQRVAHELGGKISQ